MSQLLAPARTAVSNLPLGRRISEIMKEKGAAFTQQALANRLGMSRETLRLLVNGDREIFNYELSSISNLLNVPIDRILQTDLQSEFEKLNQLLLDITDDEEVVELANSLYVHSIGYSERCDALNNIGRAYYIAHEYDQAHEAWLEAYQYADIAFKKYKDSDRLYKIVRNLMITFTIRKEYSNATEILQKVEEAFKSDPKRTGAVYYARAIISESLGRLEEAREFALKSMACYETSGNDVSLGRSQITAAHFEYRLRNFDAAKHLSATAISHLSGDPYYKLVAAKELAKALLKREEFETATEVIKSFFEVSKMYSDLEAKFHILLSKSMKTPEFALEVLNNQAVTPVVRYMACKFLIEHHKEIGDANTLVNYYGIAEELSGASNFLDMGEL